MSSTNDDAPVTDPTEVESDLEEEFDELQEEVALGGTPSGQDTNEMLRALSRAARSFLIYDPRNDAIRGFLEDYRQAAYHALKTHGEISLEVRPFELVREREVVYLERNRDRSLAFRMFRDGVRRLTITPDVEWNELLRLLEILSIRFTGIRQQEDDIVTLLLKAGFKHIEIAAVEGFVPDDETYCGDDPNAEAARKVRMSRRSEAHIEVPRDWDTPMPDFSRQADLVYRSISNEDLSEIHDGSSSRALPNDTVKLVVEMLVLVADPVDPTTPGDIENLLSEVRDFLLSEGQLGPLIELVSNIRNLMRERPQDRDLVLGSFVSERALRRIINSIPKAQETIPEDLIIFLDAIPSDHLSHLISLLATERGTTARRMLRQLITRYASRNLDASLPRLASESEEVAADLLQAFVTAAPERCVEILKSIAVRGELEIHFRMLDIMKKMSDVNLLVDELFLLMDSSVPDIRRGAMRLLGEQSDVRLFGKLMEMLNRNTGIELDESEEVGHLMAKINPNACERAFADWVTPKSIFSLKRVTIRKTQKWAAISAIGMCPGAHNVKRLNKLKDAEGEDIRQHCIRTLVQRRRKNIQ